MQAKKTPGLMQTKKGYRSDASKETKLRPNGSKVKLPNLMEA
jgi:hypothetical protein